MTSLHPAAHLSPCAGPPTSLQTVPYLLGFQPERSLVLVGLDAGRVVVTVRIDLAGIVTTTRSRRRSERCVTAAPGSWSRPSSPTVRCPWPAAPCPTTRARAGPGRGGPGGLHAAGRVARRRRAVLVLPVPRGRMLPCRGSGPPGRIDRVVAAATYAGMVALPDRASVEALLDPQPSTSGPGWARPSRPVRTSAIQAVLGGSGERHDRSVKRAIFAAARSSDLPGAGRRHNHRRRHRPVRPGAVPLPDP